MSTRLKKTITIFKQAFKKWKSKNPFRESCVIAYNAIFSLPGLLVVIITLAGYFFGHDIVTKQVHSTISQALGTDTADQVLEMIVEAMRSKDSLIATILGLTTIVLGATGVFIQMQKSLNIIWEVEATTQKSGIWPLIQRRLFSFGLILSIAFLLLISLVISAILSAASDWISRYWDDSLLWLFNVLNFLVSLLIITLLFAMMYKILPDAKIKWRLVWVGAFVTALLFVIGKSLLGIYFGKAEPGSGYGAAGSIVLIMLWTSYSSMIVFFGAEFTKAYSDMYYGEVAAMDVAVKKKHRKN